MKKIQKFCIAILIIAISFMVTGCVDAKFHVTINQDGSGDVDYKLLFDPAVQGFGIQDSKNIIDQLEIGAKEQGYTISKVTENDQTGIEAKKHIANFSEQMKKGKMFGNQSMDQTLKPGEGLSVQKGFFKTTYTFNSDLDLTSMGVQPTDDKGIKEMTAAMLKSMKFEFALTMPVKASSHNAAKTDDNGKTLVWNLTPGAHNKINVTADEWNVTHIAMASAGVVLVIILLIVILLKRRAKDNFVA